MAYNVQKINPLDLQPRKAVGVSLPFSSPSVFISNYQTKDAIKNNIINYFLTNKGERYLNPEFGSDIRSKLFENVNEDTISDIKGIISRDLSNYFPRVSTQKLVVSSTPDTNTVSVYLQYSIVQTNIEDELLINIEQ